MNAFIFPVAKVINASYLPTTAAAFIATTASIFIFIVFPVDIAHAATPLARAATRLTYCAKIFPPPSK